MTPGWARLFALTGGRSNTPARRSRPGRQAARLRRSPRSYRGRLPCPVKPAFPDARSLVRDAEERTQLTAREPPALWRVRSPRRRRHACVGAEVRTTRMMGRPGVRTHPQGNVELPQIAPDQQRGDGLSWTSKGPPGGGPFDVERLEGGLVC